MLRRLLRILFSLIGLVLLLFVFTAIGIVFDGLIDTGSHADAAIVPGHAGIDDDVAWSVVKPRLDHAIDLYKANEYSYIIVSGTEHESASSGAAYMRNYLEGQGVPTSAIIADDEQVDTRLMAHHWAAIAKERQFTSVMLVTDYAQMTRLKTALRKEDKTLQITQAHVGDFQSADIGTIIRNVYGLYAYIYRLYLVPAIEEASKDARGEAQKAKESVDKKIDSLTK